jgi:HAD superfamily hydrolase (TIGR01509 family)
MSLRGRQGWIFDLDGTLALPVHDFDGLREALGIPQGVLILEYLASRPAAEAKALGARLEALEAELIAQCRPQPGVRAALDALRDRGWHLGVVTRNSVANAQLTLEHLGLDDLFPPQAVLGRESAEPKPSPDALQWLQRHWSLDADACVMVGDHRLDLAAGRAAGVATVHFTADCPERWPEFTDHLLPHWSHLGALL